MKKLAVFNKSSFTIIRDYQDSDYQELQQHINTLNLFEKNYLRLALVEKDLRSYEQTITAYLKNEISFSELNSAIREQILHFLASFLAFLDNWKTYITRTFGPDELDTFKRATHKEFNEHFSYRFIYELRNYTLHCDNPVSRVSAKLLSDDTETVDIIINRDKLLKTYKWPDKVKLESEPEEFDLTKHMKKALVCLTRIHEVCLNIGNVRKVYESAIEVYKIRVSNKDIDGEFYIIHFEDISNNTSPSSISIIPIRLAEVLLKRLNQIEV